MTPGVSPIWGTTHNPFVRYTPQIPRHRDLLIAAAFGLAAVAAMALAVSAQHGRIPITATALLMAVALLVERRRVLMSGRISASATYLPIVLSLVIAGPLAGVVVAAFSVLAHARGPF